MKIVADQNMPLAEELFASFGQVLLLPGREITAADLIDAARDASEPTFLNDRRR